MFRTENTEPFAIRSITRVVEIAKHVVPLDLRLEDGTKRGLALVLVEATLHMPDGIADRQADTAGNALD